MARQVITSVIDDISGEPDAQTVEFAFDGATYTIDLAAKNRERLAKALQPFIEHATRVKGGAPSRRTTSRATAAREYDVAELRAWAAKNKINIPARGRIPAAVVEQFRSATAQ